MVGIVGYGAHVPSYRIKVEEIAKVWGDDPVALSNGLVVNEKSVPSPDEDTATIAVTAARYALARAQIDPSKIGAVYVGSESHPYAVKPTASIVAEAVCATPKLTAADLEFACKAGTAGIQMTMGLVESGMIEYGLAIGADTSQGAPGDALEYTASAGGAALLGIIFVTMIIRSLMLLATFKSTAGNAKMTELQPEIQKIQNKYPNSNTSQAEKQRMAEEMQRLYKKHKINPFSSLLVMIVQFPVFICGSFPQKSNSALL